MVFAALFDTNRPGNYQERFDSFTATLIVANLLALMLEHVPSIHEAYEGLFQAFDLFSLVVFSIEYLLRFYTAPEMPEFKGKGLTRLRWATQPMSIIDLAAILPFYLSLFISVDLRALRALRLLRLLKLTRILVPAIREFRERNAGRTFRQKVHSLFFLTPQSGKLGAMLDSFFAFWVLLSVVAVILETVQSIHEPLAFEFKVLDYIAVAIFSTEYLARIYCIPEDPEFKHRFDIMSRLKYGFTGGALIDVIAILPFFLELFLHHLFDLRFMRVFRLLRLLKLTRYSGAMGTLMKVMKREKDTMNAANFVLVLIIILTASLGYLFEHEAQPDKYENIPQSIYWSVITLASVGYGDISPVTPLGRMLTSILAMLGIALFAIPAGLLASAFTDQLRIDRADFDTKVREALKDGVLSKIDREMLQAEAKSLHMAPSEVDRVVTKVKRILLEEAREEAERVKQQHERVSARELLDEVKHHSGHASAAAPGLTIPPAVLAAQPELAFEQARLVIARLFMIRSALPDAGKVETLFADPSRASAQDLALWQALSRTDRPGAGA
jgi:hypothetical protein